MPRWYPPVVINTFLPTSSDELNGTGEPYLIEILSATGVLKDAPVYTPFPVITIPVPANAWSVPIAQPPRIRYRWPCVTPGSQELVLVNPDQDWFF